MKTTLLHCARYRDKCLSSVYSWKSTPSVRQHTYAISTVWFREAKKRPGQSGRFRVLNVCAEVLLHTNGVITLDRIGQHYSISQHDSIGQHNAVSQHNAVG